MQKITSKSEKETKSIAKELAQQAKGNVFALTGELGAGKTTFVQGFAQGLGIKDKIISPTFVLTRQHPVPNTTQILYHVDLYRLENIKDIHELGLEELWSNPDNIILIEWAEKIKNFLPKDTTWISITKTDEDIRQISITEH